MERFLIVTNDGKDVDHAVTSKVKETLEKAGKICTLCQKDAQKNIRKDTVPEELDCRKYNLHPGSCMFLYISHQLLHLFILFQYIPDRY